MRREGRRRRWVCEADLSSVAVAMAVLASTTDERRKWW